MEINRWTMRGMGVLIAGFILWQFGTQASNETSAAQPLARLIGLFTILTWVTVAAAGRWIGLGGAAG
jgi:hypothetical protein